jgi:hypothetical protein
MIKIKYHVGSMYWPAINRMVDQLNRQAITCSIEEEGDSKYLMIGIPESYDLGQTALYVGTIIGMIEQQSLTTQFYLKDVVI